MVYAVSRLVQRCHLVFVQVSDVHSSALLAAGCRCRVSGFRCGCQKSGCSVGARHEKNVLARSKPESYRKHKIGRHYVMLFSGHLFSGHFRQFDTGFDGKSAVESKVTLATRFGRQCWSNARVRRPSNQKSAGAGLAPASLLRRQTGCGHPREVPLRGDTVAPFHMAGDL